MSRFRLACSLVLGLAVAASAVAEGYRTTAGSGDAEIPVVVVRGTPYEMGLALGKLTAHEARSLVDGFLALVQSSGSPRFSNETLDAAWKAVGPHTSERFKQELEGLAEGAGIPLERLRRAHMVPVVSDYACSSLAAWGKATKDGHLYQTRNLDWILAARAHDRPCVVVYIPGEGIPHVNVSFAGYIGVNTGMNAQGIVLSEMGDSPEKDYPYDLNGTHFTTLFRDILYKADSLEAAVGMIRDSRRIKKYHYVVGDGDLPGAVKIKAHAPELIVWRDNDPTDELAPNVLKQVVYQDEGRGAFEPLRAAWGRIDETVMKDTSCAIPIQGGNVLSVVYDATDRALWVSYAKGETEAYTRPFVPIRLADYLGETPPQPPVATWPATPARAQVSAPESR
jgi:isopenicillin-N N-acyltransferase-like protein